MTFTLVRLTFLNFSYIFTLKTTIHPFGPKNISLTPRTPGLYPHLCEDHFSPDSFTKLPELARPAGFRLDFKPGAVPNPNLFSRKTCDQKPLETKLPVPKKKQFSFPEKAKYRGNWF